MKLKHIKTDKLYKLHWINFKNGQLLTFTTDEGEIYVEQEKVREALEGTLLTENDIESVENLEKLITEEELADMRSKCELDN